MSGDGSGGQAVSDRTLVEDAVRLLLVGAPAGWTKVHGEFEPSSQPNLAEASATTPDGQSLSLGVSAGVQSLLAEHQRRAAAAGAPWRRLILDCQPDGLLAVSTEPWGAPARVRRSQRWVVAVLAALSVGCLASAAVVFAVGWRWGPPPRVELTALPDPPARQKEAFEVISKWYEAQNQGDAAGMQALTCANPSSTVRDQIAGAADPGQRSGLVFPDAIVAFSDQGGQVWAGVVIRIRPLDDAMKLDVERAQQEDAGYFGGQFTLVDEAGGLKVCDRPTGPHD